jgi:hypothetical protein
MLVFINFVYPEDHCVQNNNIPAVVIGVKLFLIVGEHKLQISYHEVPGSGKYEARE